MDYSKYLDEHGYPGTRQADGTWDGGDTAAILGTLWFFGVRESTPLPALYDSAATNIIPLRYLDETKWYGQPDRFSRDQLIAVICGLSACRRAQKWMDAKLLFKAHKRRYFLTAWNTRKNGTMNAPKKMPDFTGPEVWALWLRIFKPKSARLVLWALDFELLASAIHWRLWRKDRVTRNHMLSLLAADKVMPTWVSRLAYRITDFGDLVQRWDDHCNAVGEYPTADLFRKYLGFDKSN